jgi:hypothetical protein
MGVIFKVLSSWRLVFYANGIKHAVALKTETPLRKKWREVYEEMSGQGRKVE